MYCLSACAVYCTPMLARKHRQGSDAGVRLFTHHVACCSAVNTRVCAARCSAVRAWMALAIRRVFFFVQARTNFYFFHADDRRFRLPSYVSYHARSANNVSNAHAVRAHMRERRQQFTWRIAFAPHSDFVAARPLSAGVLRTTRDFPQIFPRFFPDFSTQDETHHTDCCSFDVSPCFLCMFCHLLLCVLLL